jgi:hypothetical protein
MWKTAVKTLAAVMLGLMIPTNVAAEPQVLSDLELDAITAAGVLVDVSSFAAGLGDGARTHTDAITFALSGERFDLGIGFTVGQALACCGEKADVDVGSAVLGVGDFVHGATHTVKHFSPFLIRGFSMGFVLAVSFKSLVRDQHLPMLRELRPAFTH